MTCGHKCWQKTWRRFCAEARKHPSAPLSHSGAGSLPFVVALTPYKAALTPYWEAQTPRKAVRPHTGQPSPYRAARNGPGAAPWHCSQCCNISSKVACPLSLNSASGSVLHFGIGRFCLLAWKIHTLAKAVIVPILIFTWKHLEAGFLMLFSQTIRLQWAL